MKKLILLAFLFFLVLSDMQSAEIPDDSQVLIHWGRPSSEKIVRGHRYRLLSWNLYKGGREGFTSDFSRLLKQYDFIAGQEAYRGSMEAIWEREQEYHWVLAQSFLMDEGGTGVVSASRHQVDHFLFLRSPVTEPITGTPKMALIQQIPIEGGDELWILNVHAINFVSTSSFEKQIKQLSQKLKEHLGPLIVAGDFNTWSSGRMEALETFAKELSLQFVTFSPDERTTFWGSPLDHILVRDVTVHISKVLSDIDSSDHKALDILWSL